MFVFAVNAHKSQPWKKLRSIRLFAQRFVRIQLRRLIDFNFINNIKSLRDHVPIIAMRVWRGVNL